jgi:hypothetical protein
MMFKVVAYLIICLYRVVSCVFYDLFINLYGMGNKRGIAKYVHPDYLLIEKFHTNLFVTNISKEGWMTLNINLFE